MKTMNIEQLKATHPRAYREWMELIVMHSEDDDDATQRAVSSRFSIDYNTGAYVGEGAQEYTRYIWSDALGEWEELE